ncbi:hypothetical protein VNO77_16682 [Canavalia gladiata]|uniref:Uncharacterized protein n=1 Tax=Canavalia gladiata TaxID=3824 RepID=A0AAN9LHR6_CANGL
MRKLKLCRGQCTAMYCCHDEVHFTVHMLKHGPHGMVERRDKRPLKVKRKKEYGGKLGVELKPISPPKSLPLCPMLTITRKPTIPWNPLPNHLHPQTPMPHIQPRQSLRYSRSACLYSVGPSSKNTISTTSMVMPKRLQMGHYFHRFHIN